MQKKWTKETVLEESKKYSSRSEFKKNKSGAFRIAYMNEWLDEMIWLVHPTAKPVKWTKEAVFEESKKHSTVTEFRRTRQTLWRAVQMLTQKLCCQTIHDCPKVVPLHYESE